MPMPTKVEISYKTILFTAFFLIALWFLIQIRQIIFWVFISFILMSAFKPLVGFLEKVKIPRLLAIILIYIFFIGLVIFISVVVIPPVVLESIHLFERLPQYINIVLPFYTFDSATITQQLAPLSQNILKLSVGLFNNIIVLFTIFVITFYLLLERINFELYLDDFMGTEAAKLIIIIIKKVEERLGSWVRGQGALMLFIGTLTYIGLLILAIPFALPLAIIAGILEIIPSVGPIVSAIPAILVAATSSPVLALATIALYFVIQQVENHIIVPLVMRKVVGLPPLVTIVALLIGAKLAGIGGAIMAIPILVSIQSVVSGYLKMRSA